MKAFLFLLCIFISRFDRICFGRVGLSIIYLFVFAFDFDVGLVWGIIPNPISLFALSQSEGLILLLMAGFSPVTPWVYQGLFPMP